ncbi:hypothetical protein GCM10023094_07920 [Rhodococcus olei]|uniref:Uncharacterized protein n=1 Tax=Rhodococcus olei TaxID=2161675 RepID=A0ABP8NVE3_9NOCA
MVELLIARNPDLGSRLPFLARSQIPLRQVGGRGAVGVMWVGYVRFSGVDQNTVRQPEQIAVGRTFTDTVPCIRFR